MKFFFTYLLFLYRSTNQHGVHSPFVYSFITNGLYSKKHLSSIVSIKNISTKQLTAINKIILHLKCHSIICDSTICSNNKLSYSYFPPTVNTTFDAIIISEINHFQIDNILKLMHNNSILIVGNPHSEKNVPKWNALLAHPLTTALIDTFWLGFVFVRKEQKKELFVIRM